MDIHQDLVDYVWQTVPDVRWKDRAAPSTVGAGKKKLTAAPAASLSLEDALIWLIVGANGLLPHHLN